MTTIRGGYRATVKDKARKSFQGQARSHVLKESQFDANLLTYLTQGLDTNVIDSSFMYAKVVFNCRQCALLGHKKAKKYALYSNTMHLIWNDVVQLMAAN